MMELRDKVAAEVFGGHNDGSTLHEIADRILAIREIAEALDFKRRSERPRDPNSVHGVDHWAGH